MSSKNSISLTAATLICVNTMVGAGLFINPKQITLLAGSLGFLGYLISATIMLPLILTVAELARLQPVSGGLYVYSKTYISPIFGFLSGWSYFISKTTSVTLLIHILNTYFQQRIPLLQNCNILFLDFVLIAFIPLLYSMGVTVGGRIQYLFIALKIVPLITAFVAGFLLFDATTFTQTAITLTGSSLGSLIPICLYALISFEVICAVGGLVDQPEKNIRRAILRAFFFTATLNVIFQFVMYGAVGPDLAMAQTPVLVLFNKACSHPWLGNLINGIVFASISGSIFSIIASNCWNLQALGKYGHLPFGNKIAQLNRVGAPVVALAIQACLSTLIIIITHEQIPLQNMVIFGVFSSFCLTAWAAFFARKKEHMNIPPWVPLLAVASCSYIIFICLRNMLALGVSISFLSMFVIGCGVALATRALRKMGWNI